MFSRWHDTHRRLGPLLLGSNEERVSSDSNVKDLPPHRDEDQVQLDVNRSFVYYPEGIEPALPSPGYCV